MRSALAVVGVCLIGSAGCGDGPAGVALPTEPPIGVEVGWAQPDALVTLLRVVNDPLVLEVVGAIDDDPLTSRFHSLLNSLDRARPDRGLLEVRQELLRAQGALLTSPDGDHAIEHAVLAFVIADMVDQLGGDEAEGRGSSLEHLNQAY